MNKPFRDEEDQEIHEQDKLECKKEGRYTEEYYYRILNHNRRILLFDEINNISSDMVISKLRGMDILDKKSPIYLEINSPGGSVSDGMAIIDTIDNIEAPVYTIVNGYACSMAAMISIIGDKRFMYSNAVWMQHSSSDMLGGFIQHIKDATNFLIKMEKRMNTIIKEKTKLNQRQLTQIKNGELWLFSDEALKYGIVDKIL